MRYEDFVVQLGSGTAQGIEVRAACSLAGEARGRLDLTASPEGLAAAFPATIRGGGATTVPGVERHLVHASGSARPRSPVESAQALGAALFGAVFRGDVHKLLDQSLGALDREPDLGLRIKLTLDLGSDAQPQLHGLPWELLYKEDTGDFLGLSRRTPIVRYLELPRAVRPLALPETLQVLALAPEPFGQAPLDLRSERRNLETLERSVRGLDVDFVESPGLGTLRGRLLAKEVHVLHVMGHGDFDPGTGRGVVYLERADGGSERVGAEALVAVVGDFPALRLVVLNACNTARATGSGGVSPFSGLAPALIRAGLPAVLAMQMPISDTAAIAFSKAFYGRLVAGDSLEAAMAEGRQAIHAANPESTEWAVPALFLRASDGVLFTGTPDEGRLKGFDHLRAGNYEEAVRLLRDDLAGDPDRGLVLVALGVALGRGRSLRGLSFQTAKEMHRLFASALALSDTSGLAAAALLALKLDYFGANAVREPPPGQDEIFAVLGGGSSEHEDEWLLDHLQVSGGTNEILVQAGFGKRRES